MLFGLFMLSFAIFGCTLPQGRHDSGTAADDMQIRELSPHKGTSWKVPFGKYKYTATSFMGASDEGGSFGESAYLEKEYEDWKKHYVTSLGANGHLRVQRDFATYYDTVSEGQAYGMLLAVYFDDKPTFDQLEAFAVDHANKYGLMHWKVDMNGHNICELPDWSKVSGDFIHVPSGDVEYVDVSEISAYTGRQLPTPGNNMRRYLTSALDADMDMAVALIFADKRWGPDRYYTNRAITMLQAIYEYGIVTDGNSGRKLVAAGIGNWGGSWGNAKGWNPSYATLAWFPIFEDFMSKNDSTYVTGSWTTVHTDLAYLIKKIDTNLGGRRGTLPDWVDSSDLSVPKQSLTVSDRGPLPFNCYYDAVRVPWRLSLDKSWYNTANARDVPQRLRNFINSIGGLANVVDGYMPTGYPFNCVFADWNNVYDYYTDDRGVYHAGRWSRNPKPSDAPSYRNQRGEEIVVGGLHSSPSFTAMFATVLGNDGDSVIQGAYEMVKAGKETYENNSAHPFNYYGNTLRLFSLLYLTGNMKNLYTCDWKPLLHADGNLVGTQEGYYLIKNRKTGAYLGSGPDSNVSLVKGPLEDIASNVYNLWRISDGNNDGWCTIQNFGKILGFSDNKYLSYPSSLNNGFLYLNTSSQPRGYWHLKDNIFNGETHGNTLFLILPQANTHYRLYATNAQLVNLNRSTGGGKYWQFIRIY